MNHSTTEPTGTPGLIGDGNLPEFEISVLKDIIGRVNDLMKKLPHNMSGELRGIAELLNYSGEEKTSAIAIYAWISNYVAKAEKGTASVNSAENDLPDTMEEDDGDSEDLLAEPAVVPYPENAPLP
tara:strand:+ start:248 stop:625 length:378 start_codon:yes stop_codon:yes gene_type:complete